MHDNKDVPPEVRLGADAIKLAIRELAESEPETLRAFLRAIWEHTSDGASSWLGRKLLAMMAAVLFSFALWLATFRGFK